MVAGNFLLVPPLREDGWPPLGCGLVDVPIEWMGGGGGEWEGEGEWEEGERGEGEGQDCIEVRMS